EDRAGAESSTTVRRTGSATEQTTGTEPSSTSSTTTSTTVPAQPEPEWVVGADPLPLRPDGLGEVLSTPEPLRDRSLPTRDLLPPPPTSEYVSSVGVLSPEVVERMGPTWSSGCPVPLEDL